MGFDFNNVLSEIDPRGSGLIGDIFHDDTFRGITGDLGGILKGITTNISSLVSSSGQALNNIMGMFSGNFIYVIVGGVVLVSGIYVYGEMNKSRY